jgi:hypothetical protein
MSAPFTAPSTAPSASPMMKTTTIGMPPADWNV